MDRRERSLLDFKDNISITKKQETKEEIKIIEKCYCKDNTKDTGGICEECKGMKIKPSIIDIIYNCDCIEGLKLIPSDSIDLVVTDPPYFIENLAEDLSESTLRQPSKNNIFHAEWDSSFSDLPTFKNFISAFLDEIKRVTKPKAQVYMFFSYHHIHWARDMIEKKNFRFYKYLIWYKPDTMGIFPNQYGCNYEVILWFRNNKEGGVFKNHIGNSQRDVFVINSTNINTRKEAGYHPTPKPKEIIRQLIKNSSNENDIILDPFMGSGTTAICAKQTNRHFIGFEISKDYFNICQKRLSQKTLFENTNIFNNPANKQNTEKEVQKQHGE